VELIAKEAAAKKLMELEEKAACAVGYPAWQVY
jgi:hypothetical protein